MIENRIVEIEGKTISGLSVRTTNAKEIDFATAKIANLAQQFDQSVTVDYKGGARVYSVYSNFESDASGEYDILMGADTVKSTEVDLAQASINAGRYMVFSARGEVPKVVIETWMEIWSYFDRSESLEVTRAYDTDFELYVSATEVDIYISIND